MQGIVLFSPILNMLYIGIITEIGYNKVQGVKSVLRYCSYIKILTQVVKYGYKLRFYKVIKHKSIIDNIISILLALFSLTPIHKNQDTYRK